MLDIRQVSYSYADGTSALQNVSAQVSSGEVFAILGESGSGKTTLLNCIARFLNPQQGSILLDERPIQDYPEREYRQRLGVVFQGLHLFPHLPVLENMTLAPIKALGVSRAAAGAKALAMLERLRIADIADRYPAQISGGQAQRVAIARALMLDPEYLLLDEPTSALDINTTNEFSAWLQSLQGITTFIVVTHDIPFATQVADQGILLSQGRLTGSGSMQSVSAMLLASSPQDALQPAPYPKKENQLN